MKLSRSISLRVFTAILFIVTSVGIPLTAHVCAAMGTLDLFSTCTMHEKKTEEPSSSCCGEETDPVARPGEQGLSDAAFAVDGCCSDVDVSVQVTDSFVASQHALDAALPLLSVVCDMPQDAISDPFHTSVPFVADTSPPLSTSDILASTILLI